MGFLESIFQGMDGKRVNWQYEVLETTPLLHGSEHLRNLCKGATMEQKASVYRHMVNFNVHNRSDLEGYYNLSKELWDEFSQQKEW